MERGAAPDTGRDGGGPQTPGEEDRAARLDRLRARYPTFVYEDLGADTINPVPDLDLDMLSAMRAAVSCPLDLFSDTAEEAGGILRTHDVPEFVRVASPVYIKCGAISQPRQNHLPSLAELRERVRQTACVVEMLARHDLAGREVGPDERTLALPEI
jgi:hypothetical protein